MVVAAPEVLGVYTHIYRLYQPRDYITISNNSEGTSSKYSDTSTISPYSEIIYNDPYQRSIRSWIAISCLLVCANFNFINARIYYHIVYYIHVAFQSENRLIALWLLLKLSSALLFWMNIALIVSWWWCSFFFLRNSEFNLENNNSINLLVQILVRDQFSTTKLFRMQFFHLFFAFDLQMMSNRFPVRVAASFWWSPTIARPATAWNAPPRFKSPCPAAS